MARTKNLQIQSRERDEERASRLEEPDIEEKEEAFVEDVVSSVEKKLVDTAED